MTEHTLIIGDSRDMSLIKDKSIDLIVTSPPYWEIKDYGLKNQIGFGQDYSNYINSLNMVWMESFRTLKDGCRLCINIGDQFTRSKTYGRYKVIPIRTEIIRFCETIGLDYMGAIIWQKMTNCKTTGGSVVMGCLTGDTEIYTPSGPKIITDIKPGNEVLCLNNQGNIVRSICTDFYDNGEKDILQIKTGHRTINATNNHQFWVIPAPVKKYTQYSYIDKKDVQNIKEQFFAKDLERISIEYGLSKNHLSYKLRHLKEGIRSDILDAINNHLLIKIIPQKTKKIVNKFNKEPVWVKSENIKPGDFILCNKELETTQNMSFISGLFEKYGFSVNSQNINDFCEIVGIFIGDGYITHYTSGKISNQITISMYGESKANLFSIYRDKIYKVFGLNGRSTEDGLTVGSVKLCQLFHDLDLDHYAKYKKIPTWVYGLSNSCKESVLRGYVDSDGSIERKRGRTSFSSASKELIYGVKHLLNYLGIQSDNIRTQMRGPNDFVKSTTLMYILRFSYSFGSHRIGSNDKKYIGYIPTSERGLFKNSFPLLDRLYPDKVKSVKNIGKEHVFDISVKDHHNFLANGMVSHNSFPYPRNGIIKIDYEFILIFKKEGVAEKVSDSVKRQSQLSREEWNQYFSGHWTFTGKRKGMHDAPFPEELPKRLIKMFSFVGETVLDPFLGSGTTSLAALNNNRNSIGYDINNDFISLSENNLRKSFGLFDEGYKINVIDDRKDHLAWDEKRLPYKYYEIERGIKSSVKTSNDTQNTETSKSYSSCSK